MRNLHLRFVNFWTPRVITRLLSIVLAGFLSLVLFTAVVLALEGPVFPPPGGVTVTPSDPSGRQIGFSGGIDYAYSDFDFSQFETLYWGAVLTDAVGFAFDGAIDEPGETMVFDADASNLIGGMARWTGSSQIAYWSGGGYVQPTLDTRFTLRVSDSAGNPVPMLLGSDLGLPGSGVLITVTGNYTANMLMEAYYSGSWQPALYLFNMLHTPGSWGGNVQSRFSGEFYYEDVPLDGLSATNDSPTPYGSTTVLTATVVSGTHPSFAWAFGDGAQGTGAVASHVYPGTGIYTATVTATNDANSITATTRVTITDAPIAGLSAGNDSPQARDEPTTLTATVTGGSNISYAWAFGDGAYGSGAVTTHTYPVGYHVATVTATNSINELVATTRVTAPLHVDTTTPPANGLAAPPNVSVTMTFNGPVDPATVDGSSFLLGGSLSGPYSGTFSFPAAEQAVFDAHASFKPGEIVAGVATSATRSTRGVSLVPYTWQFWTAVGGGSGHFVDSGQALGTADSVAVALGDLDGDGDLDAFVGNQIGYGGGPNAVWLNDGTGVFADSGQSLGSGYTSAVLLGDLDGDGDLDGFEVNYDTQPNRVWLNDGTGIFTDSGQNLGSMSGLDGVLGDLDGDGDLDALVANSGYDRVWLNDGSGVFADSGQNLSSGTSIGAALGDVDSDGDLDAFVVKFSGFSGAPEEVWLNDGRGNFTDSGQRLGNHYSRAVTLGDLDADGDLDAFVSTQGANVVWENDGSGLFTDSGQSLGSSFSPQTALGDVDADGDLDAFVANASGAANALWLNDGAGSFTDSGQAPGTGSSAGVALGDVDADGDLDAFVSNSNAEPNVLWFNQNQTDLTLSKLAPSQPVIPGEAMSYTLVYANSGSQMAADVVITDVVPITLTQVEYTFSGPPITPTGSLSYTWQVADLEPGDGGLIVVRGVVSAPLPVGTAFTNTAVITSSTAESTPADNRDVARVTVGNAPPVAHEDTQTVQEDSADHPFHVLANDGDANGDPLALYAVGVPDQGGNVIHASAVITYTPAPDFFGLEVFTYTVADGNGAFGTAQVFVTVTNQADPPLAMDDVYTTAEDVPLVVAAPGVLENDVDVDGDTLSATLAVGPVSGTLDLRLDGAFTYTPPVEFSGSEIFTYTASDGNGGSDVARVDLVVTDVNEPPLAVDDAYTTTRDTPLVVAAPGVLGNDSDPDSASLTATLEAGPVLGLLDLELSGGFVYTPAVSYVGPVTFTYVASDGESGSTAMVTIEVEMDAYFIYLPVVLRE